MGKREKHSPQAIGAHFANIQASMGGELIKVLTQTIQAYTAGQEAEYTAMVEGYGEQANAVFNKATAKVRKSEFKKVADHASKQETRNDLMNIIGNYDSVQKLVSDLRKLEKGTAEIDEEGKVKPIKAEKAEGEGETEGEEVVVKVDSQPAMIDTLEKVMQAVYDAGYLNAADLIQQAMASIGRGEKA